MNTDFPNDFLTLMLHQSRTSPTLNNTNLQCFSTRLLRAIFSPISVQTGLVNPTLAKSALTAMTRPPVDKEPIFTIKTSFFDSF